MLEKLAPRLLIFVFLLLSAAPVFSQNADPKNAQAKTRQIISEIVEASFPELESAEIRIKTFDSKTDYFRSRFSFSRFFTFRHSHFLIFVNPKIYESDAPDRAVRAIIAHELAHAAYYRRHNRFELFGLIALTSKSFTARFERAADLQAIERGYGAGLIEYRKWLYRNIPAEKIARKKRDYFSPEEIERILEATKEKPELFDFWRKNIPRDLAEINHDIAGR